MYLVVVLQYFLHDKNLLELNIQQQHLQLNHNLHEFEFLHHVL